MTRKILVLAGDTDGNLGDLAIVSATCDYLRQLDPHAEISLVTSCPERDRERLGIRPIRRGWRGVPALVETARRADLVICGGGGLFQDDDSLVKMPYWALRLCMIRLFNKRISGLSIGAGPLNHSISRVFARLALRMLHPITVRDKASQVLLEPLASRPVKVVPDPAFLLQSAQRMVARQILGDAGVPLDRTPLIGVAARRLFHVNSNLIPHKYIEKLRLGSGRGREPMEAFIRNVASSLDQVVSTSKAHVVFLPTYTAAHENDAVVCERIALTMQTSMHSILRIDDPKIYKAVCGLMSVMLCGRMHAAILAAAEGTPIVGLSYNPKFFGMFSLLGLEDQSLSVGQLAAGYDTCQLSGLLSAAIENPAATRPQTAAIEQTTRHFLESLLEAMLVNTHNTASTLQTRR